MASIEINNYNTMNMKTPYTPRELRPIPSMTSEEFSECRERRKSAILELIKQLKIASADHFATIMYPDSAHPEADPDQRDADIKRIKKDLLELHKAGYLDRQLVRGERLDGKQLRHYVYSAGRLPF